MKKLALILLAGCCLCETGVAQGTSRKSDAGAGQRTSGNQSGGSRQSGNGGNSGASRTGRPSGGSQTSGVQTSGSQTSRPSRRSSSGRQISGLKPLKTQSGTMPGFLQRAGERMAGQSQQTGQGQRQQGQNSQSSNSGQGSRGQGSRDQGGGTSGHVNQSGLASGQQQNLQQVFLNNALLFDSNSDQQLTSHELRNLFILMISNSNVNNNYLGGGYWGGNGYGNFYGGGVNYGQTASNGYRPSSGSSNGQNSTGQNSTGGSQAPALAILLADSIPTVEGTTLRDATLLFLLLTMQFDSNGDGALDQSELQRFASALLNNELSLAQATQQLQPE